jgi:hypothetical protein
MDRRLTVSADLTGASPTSAAVTVPIDSAGANPTFPVKGPPRQQDEALHRQPVRDIPGRSPGGLSRPPPLDPRHCRSSFWNPGGNEFLRKGELIFRDFLSGLRERVAPGVPKTASAAAGAQGRRPGKAARASARDDPEPVVGEEPRPVGEAGPSRGRSDLLRRKRSEP